MFLLCHPWFTTTNLSYTVPILETSATASCGTTGSFEVRDGRYYKYRSIEEKETETKYYTLIVGDKKEMTNGFRYIKELVLQRHNFKMYQDYFKLINSDVKVYSVKTDAFIIGKKDMKKAKKLIDFSQDRGVENRK